MQGKFMEGFIKILSGRPGCTSYSFSRKTGKPLAIFKKWVMIGLILF
jgi:hypothetical protein